MPLIVSRLLRILLIGGYGYFGRRLADRLALDPSLRVTLAGRHLAAAQAVAQRLSQGRSAPRFDGMRLDIEAPGLAEALRACKPDVVVHTAGPFQARDYRVAQACIEAGAHYIDLADARDFVAGISGLDDAAKRRGLLVTSGASSVPALSAAVVDHFAPEFSHITTIDVGISPGNRTERGLATVRAILGYCGAPLRVWRGGRWITAHGWQDLRRRRYPDPVGMRWLANCDVPDLQLFPARCAGVQQVNFGAGLELSVLHLGLWLLAGLRRAGLVSDWSRFARALKGASDLLAGFGSENGAMHVELSGFDRAGAPASRLWTLVAERGHGPYVPVLAGAAMIGKLARGEMEIRGAMPCVGLLTLSDFHVAMSGLAIRTRVDTL